MKQSLLFLLLAITQLSFAQNPYFQQQTDYVIRATLDDQRHTLDGDIEITYTNNSAEELTALYLHLWGNAFKNNRTAFCEQKLRMGSTRFYFAKDSDLGYFSGLDFTVGNEKAIWQLDKENPDIAVVTLPKPLKTKEKVVLKTPFRLKIPASFSRLGHVGTSYQMTQWYPKPAVFDHKGWHTMPYLDMGEFYSEFGNFDVTITLPENYVVGATGVLQTESERRFLQQKVEETQRLISAGFPKSDSFPPSSPAMKTIRYTAENVHDFAWFADKRFHVLKGEAMLASGRKVDTWAMFTNAQAKLWTKGADYVTRAVGFYSKHIGEYPWPQATAVHSALSAGGGMEYPMITVIGQASSDESLDQVITHEVGHNWFYGILATNERDHAWMDEGINSYYEYRYLTKYYGDRVSEPLPAFLTKGTGLDLYETALLYMTRRNYDQAPETPSNGFSAINYGLSSYMKPGTAFGHLEQYLGTERFDRIMQLYYSEWKFRHPYPEDLRALFERESGKDLSWFFDGYLFSTKKVDYVVKNSIETAGEYRLRVENKGEIAAPFPVSGLSKGEIVATQWFEGFTGEQEIVFPKCDCDQFILDAQNATLDVNRKNNLIKTGGLLKKMEPLQLRILPSVENTRRTTLFALPTFGRNVYDGFMPGIALYNTTVPAKKLEFAIASMYGIKSGKLEGLGGLKYNLFPKAEKVKKISFGLTSKAFSYDRLRKEGAANEALQYRRIAPFVRVDLMRSHTSNFFQTLQLRSLFIDQQIPDSVGLAVDPEREESTVTEFSWTIGNRRALNPYRLRLALEHYDFQDIFMPTERAKQLKINAEWNYSYTYDQNRSFDVRIFAGGFLSNDYRDRGVTTAGAYTLTGQGYNDYQYDEFYIGRNEASGIWSQQIMLRDGGMKVAANEPTDNDGRSNDFLFALNLKADLPQDLPLKLPVRPYFDFGYAHDNRPISAAKTFSDQVWWQGGFAIEAGNGIFGIYFPVLNSKTLRGGNGELGAYKEAGRSTYWERITFTIDLARLDPWRILEDLQF